MPPGSCQFSLGLSQWSLCSGRGKSALKGLSYANDMDSNLDFFCFLRVLFSLHLLFSLLCSSGRAWKTLKMIFRSSLTGMIGVRSSHVEFKI